MPTFDVLRAGSWSRPRRLAWTGPSNPAFIHGRYTNRRRWRLEKPLDAAMRELTGDALFRLHHHITRLPGFQRDRARAAMDALGAFMPVASWALPYERPGKPTAWYVPRVAAAHCAKFLRAFAALKRLLFFGASLMRPLMPTLVGEKQKDRSPGQSFDAGSTFQDRRQRELRRFADYCARQGLSITPVT